MAADFQMLLEEERFQMHGYVEILSHRKLSPATSTQQDQLSLTAGVFPGTFSIQPSFSLRHSVQTLQKLLKLVLQLMSTTKATPGTGANGV